MAIMVSSGKNIVLAKGWDFTQGEYEAAWAAGRLLTVQMDLRDICNLNCEYCFRAGNDDKRLPKTKGEMGLEQISWLVESAVEMGAKAFNIIGAGEPALDGRLPAILEKISSLKATPILATNGLWIPEKLLQKLWETGSSIVLKVGSFNADVQDASVGRKGYAKKRDENLGKIIGYGFNKPAKDGSYQTRLGVNSIIMRGHYDENLEVLRFCWENNCMPVMATFIPVGRAAGMAEAEPSLEEYTSFSRKARQIAKTEYGIEYAALFPYLGGVPCTQSNWASLYVQNTGKVLACSGEETPLAKIEPGDEKAEIGEMLRICLQKLRARPNNGMYGCTPRLKHYGKI